MQLQIEWETGIKIKPIPGAGAGILSLIAMLLKGSTQYSIPCATLIHPDICFR